MSIKNYRFVSPGVFVNEIDNSQLPASPAGIGPVIIGRAAKGPALRPTTVNSFEEFVNVFGTPSPGNAGDDVWRQGANTTATTYGMYAAQAYLRNSSPLTYIRLLGAESDNVTDDQSGLDEAGWTLGGEAYGLVLFTRNSSSAPSALSVSGALAAIFYTDAGTDVKLSGSIVSSSAGAGTTGNTAFSSSVGSLTGSDALFTSATGGTNKEFTALIVSGSGQEKITFNFTRGDSKYIRKVFNTNPQLTNTRITDASQRKSYFLGETFDQHIDEIISTPSNGVAAAVVKVSLQGGTETGDDFKYQLQPAETPFVIASKLDPSETPKKLFKFVARGEAGDWTSSNLKISIQDIKRSPSEDSDYGTFSVVVRHISDSDNVVRVVEQFNNCDLNPNSLNYVARKIGDKYESWVESDRLYREYGNYPNNSAYIYIDMNSDVDAGFTNAALLPFGFEGIVKYTDEASLGSGAATTEGNWITGSIVNPIRDGEYSPVADYQLNSPFIISGSGLTASVAYPRPLLRANATQGNLANPTDAYFGLQTARDGASTVYARSVGDILRPRGGIVGQFTAATGLSASLSPTFTLDDISGSGVWSEGSSTSNSLTFVNGAISGVLDAGYDRFTVPLYGGFDGLDITEMDPFTSAAMPGAPSDTTSYSFFSIRRAIDSVADPEVVEMNLAAIPGQTQDGLTTHLVRTCEDRADALAVIDLPSAFQPREDSTSIDRLNTPSTITTLVNGLRDRNLNSSYGCAYYPWVRARDTINGAFVWLPPSVAAVGTFSSSQRRTQVWFAPAGFNRGGLTEGSAGIPVVDVAHQLRRKDRDDLYSANINPIAKFPAEGIVIFGQKTLQLTPSALDRINVRRLMIFVKKRISQIASGLLFDPNVQQTWKRFTAQVNPFLADVKTNFGLSDYRVVLDDTTTTPDLVDRNILYAKIYLKPTRAIEFIAIDFNITRTGASFDD
jgi:hypothetical protein